MLPIKFCLPVERATYNFIVRRCYILRALIRIVYIHPRLAAMCSLCKFFFVPRFITQLNYKEAQIHILFILNI